MNKAKICVTGATGTMGMATLRELINRTDRFDIVAFARPSKNNPKKLASFMSHSGCSVVWGDLMNINDVRHAVSDADYILHMGGMVSPQADYYPQRTLIVNVEGTRNVVNAVLEGSKSETAKFVYVGSVAQSGDRRPPLHWSRTGDPLEISIGDAYALSKVEAEKVVVDSGLKHWVSLRQTGILYPELLLKGSDPITFHVPLKGLLEWATAEDSGRLMANVCEASVPDNFWNKFYNIGSGESYRLSNYEFEKLLMKALGCPPPEKVFEPSWFVLKNFHSQWWQDSDVLESIVPFRSGETCDEYFKRMANSVPWYFKLAPIAPAFLIKAGMKMVAKRKPLGTLYWLSAGVENKIKAYFGSKEEWQAIPNWKELSKELATYPDEPRGKRIPPKEPCLSHGYDETKPTEELDLSDMKMKAKHHGGECLSTEMKTGDLATPLKWRCRCGHHFSASPAAVLLGGHWCPECLRERYNQM
jgi:nucleoside-diphosphate-sugar epimerase